MIEKSRTFLLSLVVWAAMTAALAPTAPASGFGFAPGTIFAKAHDPANEELPNTFLSFIGVFNPGGATAEDWVQELVDAPEVTQAGGHPDFTTSFDWLHGAVYGEYDRQRTLLVDAPAGSVGNPRAVARCEASDFYLTLFGACPPESQVGEAITRASGFKFLSPVSSLIPSLGVSATLGFKAFAITVTLNPEVRSDSDYGLRIAAEGITMAGEYTGTTLTLWGVPYDPIHDLHRVDSEGNLGGEIATVPKPFLSAPTNCQTGPVTVGFKSRSWQDPNSWIEENDEAAEPTGCGQIGFEPTLSARPSTTLADSPSGLEVDLHVPQNESCEIIPALEGRLEEFRENGGAIEDEVQSKRFNLTLLELSGATAEEIEQAEEELRDAREELTSLVSEPFYGCGLATSHLKDATVSLPEGLVVNPASANGLDGCSASEAGLTTALGASPIRFNGKPASCPDASRIGSVEVDTPLLDNPMQGSVFLASPYDNPFKSFLALYIAVDDPQTGIVATLPGEVKADPSTGQLTARFPESPQLPFEHFFLHFKQGPHAPLRTPATCGTYATDALLSGYANPDAPVATTDAWQIDQGPGGSCAAAAASLPNASTLDAGTVSPSAASYSPFVMHLRREDGTQPFKSLTVSPPEGLVAKLAGVAKCSEADLATAAAKAGKEEQVSPSCPASSRIGEVVAGAGAGPSPYYAKGQVYLSGPYKGAPLSMAIVTPATAGPFDLGTIVVRTALYVDPVTAKITAVSEDIPQILGGIPLDVRTIDLFLDREQFTETGTSCDPASVDAQLTSSFGQIVSISSRFQLAECSSLGFKPKLALHLKGGTKRGKHPALTAILTPRPGDANIASASVALPRSEFLDQAHIGTVCTRVQFAADQCPKASIYGTATVTTPLFDFPLTGNVYLRSSDNELPDLVPDLRGPADTPVKVEAAGRTDSIRGGIRNSFDFVPDAPFTKLVMRLDGGKKGLLQNSRDICANTFRATVKFTAHNGKAREGHPALRSSGCASQPKGRGHGASKHGTAR